MNNELTAIGIDHPILACSTAIEELLLDPLIPASRAL
jgi:hypothetical protein